MSRANVLHYAMGLPIDRENVRTYATVTCDRNPHPARECRKAPRVQVVRTGAGVAVTWLKAARASSA